MHKLTQIPHDNNPDRKLCRVCRKRLFDGDYIGTWFPIDQPTALFIFYERVCSNKHGRGTNGTIGRLYRRSVNIDIFTNVL